MYVAMLVKDALNHAYFQAVWVDCLAVLDKAD
jgi:hypothetical protein